MHRARARQHGRRHGRRPTRSAAAPPRVRSRPRSSAWRASALGTRRGRTPAAPTAPSPPTSAGSGAARPTRGPTTGSATRTCRSSAPPPTRAGSRSPSRRSGARSRSSPRRPARGATSPTSSTPATSSTTPRARPRARWRSIPGTATPGESSGTPHLEVGRYAEAERAYRRMLETGDDLYAHARSAALAEPARGRGGRHRGPRARPRARPGGGAAGRGGRLGRVAARPGALEPGRSRGRRARLPRGPRHGPGLPPGPRRARPGAARRGGGPPRPCRSSSRRSPWSRSSTTWSPSATSTPARPAGRRRAPVRPGRAHRPAERAQPGPLQPRAGLVLRWTTTGGSTRRSRSRAGSSRPGRTSTRTTSSPGRLYKAGQPEAARAAMAEALRLGTRDARLFYHAGMIERALGNTEAAAAYLRQALATNPHFHPRHADEARRALEALDGAGASRPRPRGLRCELAGWPASSRCWPWSRPDSASAHPMGNFSISHYAAIHVEPDGVRLRYVLDLAEIPTFQALQAEGLPADPEHPGVRAYLARAVETLADGLTLELDGRRLALRSEARRAHLPAGRGRAADPQARGGVPRRAAAGRRAGHGGPHLPGRQLPRAGGLEGDRRDRRAGRDARRQHRARARPEPRAADYPTDPAESPPQALEAQVVFARAASGDPGRRRARRRRRGARDPEPPDRGRRGAPPVPSRTRATTAPAERPAPATRPPSSAPARGPDPRPPPPRRRAAPAPEPCPAAAPRATRFTALIAGGPARAGHAPVRARGRGEPGRLPRARARPRQDGRGRVPGGVAGDGRPRAPPRARGDRVPHGGRVPARGRHALRLAPRRAGAPVSRGSAPRRGSSSSAWA